MNIDRWKKLREEYTEDDLEGTDGARKKRARQTPGQETMEDCGCMNEEEKKGPLNKIMRDSGGNKKFKVYVRDPSTGNIKTVRFGDPNLSIKRDQKSNRESFMARMKPTLEKVKGQKNLSPVYWAIRSWKLGTKIG